MCNHGGQLFEDENSLYFIQNKRCFPELTQIVLAPKPNKVVSEIVKSNAKKNTNSSMDVKINQ